MPHNKILGNFITHFLDQRGDDTILVSGIYTFEEHEREHLVEIEDDFWLRGYAPAPEALIHGSLYLTFSLVSFRGAGQLETWLFRFYFASNFPRSVFRNDELLPRSLIERAMAA